MALQMFDDDISHHAQGSSQKEITPYPPPVLSLGQVVKDVIDADLCRVSDTSLDKGNASFVGKDLSSLKEIKKRAVVSKTPTCYFPFIANGIVYNKCTMAGQNRAYWCATTDNYDRDGLWAWCTGPGTNSYLACYFPFLYKGVLVSNCQVGAGTGDEWCAYTSNYDKDGKAIYCLVLDFKITGTSISDIAAGLIPTTSMASLQTSNTTPSVMQNTPVTTAVAPVNPADLHSTQEPTSATSQGTTVSKPQQTTTAPSDYQPVSTRATDMLETSPSMTPKTLDTSGAMTSNTLETSPSMTSNTLGAIETLAISSKAPGTPKAMTSAGYDTKSSTINNPSMLSTGSSKESPLLTSTEYLPDTNPWRQLEHWLNISSENGSADMGLAIIPYLQNYTWSISSFGLNKDEVPIILYILGNITENAFRSNETFSVATLLDILYIANQLLNDDSWKPAASKNTVLGPRLLNCFENILAGMPSTNQSFNVSHENIEFQCLAVPCSSMINGTAVELWTHVNVSLTEEDNDLDFHPSCMINLMSLSYKSLAMFFPGDYEDNEDPGTSYEVGGHILTNAMLFDSKSYHSAHVNMTFICNGTGCDPTAICVFWNFTLGKWSSEGCITEITDDVTNCFCSHLTSFSLLIAKYVPGGLLNSSVLDYLTNVGLIISIASLVVCISLQTYLMKFTLNLVAYYRHLAILNVSTFLLLSNVSFVAASFIRPKVDVRLCLGLTFCTHFSLLAFFCWTLVQSIFLLCRLVFVFHHITKRQFMTFSTLLGYVCPALISIGTFLYYTPSNDYRRDTTCWLNSNSAASMAFTIPTIIIISANFLVLLVVIRKILRPSISEGSTEDEEVIKKLVKAVVFCTPQFGLTWAIGIPLLTNGNSLALHYLFVLLNPLQGFFIFVFGCVLDKRVIDLVKKRLSKNPVFNSTATTLSTY
ncbi:adhesion G-protein coupled receptor F3 [Pelodytes ibericus]